MKKIPGLEKYPDLRVRMDYELSRKHSGCVRCAKARIIQKYSRLVKERENATPRRRRAR